MDDNNHVMTRHLKTKENGVSQLQRVFFMTPAMRIAYCQSKNQMLKKKWAGRSKGIVNPTIMDFWLLLCKV